jgi:hypothetical protein
MSSLEQQDSLPRTGERARKGASARAGSDAVSPMVPEMTSASMGWNTV